MQDPDTINQENTINYKIRLEEREIKNKIQSSPISEKKKQEVWSRYFIPRSIPDDSYLRGNIF